MYNFLTKYGQTIAFGVGALIAILFVLTAVGGVSSLGSPTNEELYETSIFDLGLKATYVLLVVAAIALVGFGLLYTATNLKASLKGLIGFAVLLLIFIIARSVASDEVTETMNKFGVSAATGKGISGALTTLLIMMFGALIIAVAAEIRGLFK